MEIKTTEFFKNIKHLPPPGTKEFDDLVNWEIEKCSGGVTIGGVYFSGWLYWHLNHWWIRVDDVDEWGNDVRKPSLPQLRDNEWMRAEYIEQCRKERKGYIEIGSRQGGKELADYEPLITDNGEIRIGDAKIGDKIFGKDGKLCTITGVYPQGVKPIYRMHLIDGRYIDCGENHLWEVYDNKGVKYIKTTKELINSKLSFKHKRSGYTYKYSLSNIEEVQFSKKDLPIHPYVLGALLGDGCTTGGTNAINNIDEEFLDEFKRLLPDYKIDNYKYIKSGKKLEECKYTIVYRGDKKLPHNENPLNKELKLLKLKRKAPFKFIPEIYKYSSIEDRYELIRGLLDTDGSISSDGAIELKLSSKQLIDDAAWVLRSLGIQCRIGTLDTIGKIQQMPNNKTFISDHLYYRLYVKTDKPIFKLSRKLNRITKRTRSTRTSIVGIDYLCDYSATCITVDNEDKIFLTKDFIPTHNSEMEASYFGMNAILFRDTQNLIICGNDNDLSLLKDKVDFGLKHLWDGINIPRLDKTWKLNQIRLGYKKPDGDDEIWSYIIIRNARDGNETEVGAGTTAKTFVMDEVGKYPFAAAFKAAEPAIKGTSGWRTVPLLTGTGGSFDNGKDAENFFYNPKANNFLAVTDPNSNRESGAFFSGLYRMDCKYNTTLADWLIKERGMTVPNNSELYKIPIAVSDKEKALALIEKERAAAKGNPDKTIYLKQVMYYPFTVEECFLSVGDNIFDIEGAKRQKSRITSQEKTGVPVILYQEDGEVRHSFTDKLPITNFPLRPKDDKDAPIVIYEFPVSDTPPYGLYTAGCLPVGEKVITTSGLQNVEDVSFDDKLINIEGNGVEIINLQRYLKKEEDVYEVRLSNNCRKTSFTKEHPIYVSEEHYTYFDGKNKLIDEDKFNFEFKEIKNVNIGDWVKSPNKYINENNFDINLLWKSLNYRKDRIIESPLNKEDFWWFIGLWLGDGWCTKDKITISCNIKELITINRLYEIVPKLFNRSLNQRIRNNGIELTFSSQQLSDFLNLHFKKYSITKEIPEWVKRISIINKQQLINGYLDADGCITFDKNRKLYGLDFVSINLSLLEGIQDILFSLGIISGVTLLRKEGDYTFRNNKKSFTKETYQLRVGHYDTVKFKRDNLYKEGYKLSNINLENVKEIDKRSRKGCFFSKCNKYIYFQIKEINKHKYSGWVYNFECETNTYMCNNIPTHNCDPYRQGKAAYSDSLGAVYIYKRMHDITGEKYQNMFVASYVARPDKKETWNEQARLLIKFYNARALCENDDISFIEYMKSKGDALYLEKQPEWLMELVPNSTVKRDYGIHRSAIKIVDYLHTCLKQYMEEEIYADVDKDGNEIHPIMGVNRILDPVLLEEIIQYNEKDNFDRVVAAELAIAQAIKMDPIIGRIEGSGDSRIKSLYVQRTKPTLFAPSRGLFNQRTRKLFL
jgi:hypothetical protein